jgi:hypothetical protein
VAGGILHDVWYSLVWSVECLAGRFLSVTYCGEAFPSLGVQGVEGLIMVGALFLLDREGEEKERKEKKEERKKIAVGKEGFPRSGPTLLAVQSVTALRCN